MKILGREIKIKIERCPYCGHYNLIIEFKTKKWFKGKEIDFGGI